ncbi:hypothetical protein ACFWPV_27610 [Streptomyces uncialis]|uniref:hypothetical protein n=1 Tax=Streptomyces uncialis TaxID=1048205 RepID=UPI0036601B17
MEHRLLKLELAAAGHHAEPEVRGPDGNWQDDVMVSSSHRSVRMAWEAQVSAITTQEITERTVRFAKDGEPFPRPGETEGQTRPHPDQRPLPSAGCPATHPCRGD